MKKTKQVVVKVSQRHISNGIAGEQDSCPIALALRGVVKCGASVLSNQVVIGGKFYATPKSARKFVEKFDDDVKVKPFNFRMRLPVASLINHK